MYVLHLTKQNTKNMELQLGNRYERVDGKRTGRLELNPERSITYPFKDPKFGYQYDRRGNAYGYNLECAKISAVIYEHEQNEPSYMICIDHAEYERLKKENENMKLHIKDTITKMKHLQRTINRLWLKLPEEFIKELR